jgi:hypothetical protein
VYNIIILRINGAAGFLKIWPNMVILPISLGKIHQMNKGKGERLKAEGKEGERFKVLYPPPSLRDTSASGGQEDRGKEQGKGESFCLTVDLFVDYRLGKLLKLVQNNIGVRDHDISANRSSHG